MQKKRGMEMRRRKIDWVEVLCGIAALAIVEGCFIALLLKL